jgi:hypothetical protein
MLLIWMCDAAKYRDFVVLMAICQTRQGGNYMICRVKLVWDSESNCWYTETDDVPGLILGSESFDNLVEKVRLAAPEMLELNLGYHGPVNIIFEAERIEQGVAV